MSNATKTFSNEELTPKAVNKRTTNAIGYQLTPKEVHMRTFDLPETRSIMNEAKALGSNIVRFIRSQKGYGWRVVPSKGEGGSES